MPTYSSGSTRVLSAVGTSLSTVRRRVSPAIERTGRVQMYPLPLRSTIAPAEAGYIGLASAGQLPATPITERIGRTEGTVKVHLKNILQKLDVRDRTEAVTTALRRGFIRLD